VRRAASPWLVVPAATLLSAAGAAALGAAGVHLPECPSQAWLGVDCVGCGATRSVTALADGRLVDALDHNALVPLAVLAVVWLAASWWFARRGRPLPDVFAARPARWAAAAAVAGFAVLRLLPVGPGPFLASGLS
jgi:hypothetical protein